MNGGTDERILAISFVKLSDIYLYTTVIFHNKVKNKKQLLILLCHQLLHFFPFLSLKTLPKSFHYSNGLFAILFSTYYLLQPDFCLPTPITIALQAVKITLTFMLLKLLVNSQLTIPLSWYSFFT